MTSTPLVLKIAQAIAVQEGLYKPGSVAQRDNDPGNLRSWGHVPVVGGYANFPTVADGWNALYQQVQKNIDRKLTLYEFFAGQRNEHGIVVPNGYAGFAPSADANNPKGYAEFVAQRVGIDPSTPLSEVVLP